MNLSKFYSHGRVQLGTSLSRALGSSVTLTKVWSQRRTKSYWFCRLDIEDEKSRINQCLVIVKKQNYGAVVRRKCVENFDQNNSHITINANLVENGQPLSQPPGLNIINCIITDDTRMMVLTEKVEQCRRTR